MKEFSIEEFADELGDLAAGMPLLEVAILEEVGVTVERAAKDKIGQYQAQAGQFEPWQPLAQSTKEDRVRGGYPEDEPGLRSGQMRASIEHKVIPSDVYIGSNDDEMLWFELGTVKQPARSVLGGAALEQAEKVVIAAGLKLEAYLQGGKII